MHVPVRRVVAGEEPCSSALDLPSEAVTAGFADVGTRDAMALPNRQSSLCVCLLSFAGMRRKLTT